MHVWARWQHQKLDVDLTAFGGLGADACTATSGCKVKQGFDNWDLFQVGGVIFF
jgi:hypothetical protein